MIIMKDSYKPIKVRACSRCGGVKVVEHFYGKDHYCVRFAG